MKRPPPPPAAGPQPPGSPTELFGADFHLDLGAWLHRPIRGDSMWSFQYFVQQAIARQVRAVVLAGDITDKDNPPPAVCEFIRRMLDTLQAYTISVYYIRGQHDGTSNPPWLLALHDWPVPMHKQLIDFGGFRWYGLDYQTADKLPGELEAIPKEADGLVCHQVWQEFMGDVTSPEGSLAQIPHVRYVFTGDLHKCTKVTMYGATGNQMQVYSPGATNLRRINEPSAAFYLGWSTPSPQGFQRLEIPTRPVLDADWRSLTSEEAIHQQLPKLRRAVLDACLQTLADLDQVGAPESVKEPLLRIKHTGDFAILDKVKAELGPKVHVFEQVSQRGTDDEKLPRVFENNQEATLEAILATEFDPQSQDYAVLQRLLKARNMKAELAMIRNEWLDPEEKPLASAETGAPT